MEIRQLVAFVKVSELGSFSKAAHVLNYTPSAITMQIRNLEDELNVQLLERFGKTVLLTPPGKEFLHHAQAILHECAQAEAALKSPAHVKRPLHIGTIASMAIYKLPSVLKYFYETYPDTSIKITTSSPNDIISMMERNQIDIAYILDDTRSNTDWVKVMEAPEPIVFVAGMHHPLARLPQVTIDDLLTQTFFLTEKQENYRRSLDYYLATRNKAIIPFLEIGNVSVLIELVKQNYGLSFLPQFAISKSVTDKELTILNVTDFTCAMCRQILYHNDKYVTDEMNAFIALADSGML
ncbi:MAG: LysR family transcriptional regulator [Treponema sp.]|nr:LysR family transcriptional regulator [Treponema sp.]